MATRTFKQLGQGYGSGPMSITAKIDGNTVYSGEVFTVDAPFPPFTPEGEQVINTLFSWENPSVSFQGTQTMEIIVSGPEHSAILLAQTMANWPPFGNAANSEVANNAPNNWNYFYWFQDPSIGNATVADPFTNEAVDGVSLDYPHVPPDLGQLYHKIDAGSVFTATVNILPGLANVANVANVA